MRSQCRIISSVMLAATFLLLGSACAASTDTSGDGSGIRISFLNQTGVQLSVVVDGPAFSPTTISASNCGLGGGLCTTDEFPGVVGDVISFTPSVQGVSGSGTCRVGPGMWSATAPPSGSEYGVVDFQSTGNTIHVGCIYLWQ